MRMQICALACRIWLMRVCRIPCWNHCSACRAGTLPPSWADMAALSSLNLSQSNLTGALKTLHIVVTPPVRRHHASHRAGTLPPSWANMAALSSLSLFQNDLTGALKTFHIVVTPPVHVRSPHHARQYYQMSMHLCPSCRNIASQLGKYVESPRYKHVSKQNYRCAGHIVTQ